MNPILKKILAAIAGVLSGSALNMLIVIMSGTLIALPEGVDVTDPESLQNAMHLFEPKHFIAPFLAHALGTLLGAFVAAKIAGRAAMQWGIGIGVFFLIGGIANAVQLQLPTGFMVLDLSLAYLPMGWLGGKLANKKKTS